MENEAKNGGYGEGFQMGYLIATLEAMNRELSRMVEQIQKEQKRAAEKCT
jgi:hypothetical protein